jgi:hypothetical protein
MKGKVVERDEQQDTRIKNQESMAGVQLRLRQILVIQQNRLPRLLQPRQFLRYPLSSVALSKRLVWHPKLLSIPTKRGCHYHSSLPTQ